MKKSEEAKTSEREDGVDMISKLPDDVLQSILSRLQDTEEAIRTSMLSTRWRYLWTSVPSIDVDCTRRLSESESNGFKEFVYWVLLNKPQDLNRFRLRCANLYNMLTIRQWIYAVVMRNVKLLDLMFCPRDKSEDIQLPHCLVTCGSLEVLKLCLLGRRLYWPKNITGGFQALKVVELREVDLSDDVNVVNHLLESCQLLEDLSLIDCYTRCLYISSPKLKNLRIDTRNVVSDQDDNDDVYIDMEEGACLALEICCPKLEFLKLIGYVALSFFFENLHSLKKAVIHPEKMFVAEEPSCNFLADISHVESLSINVYCITVCFDPEVDAPIISLPNLKTLELTINGSMNMDALIPFLKCLPNLESLHLIFPKNMHLERTWNLEEAETLSILTRHLKKVEFLDFNEGKSKLFLARLLLGHGNELEEMVFSWGHEAKFHKRSMKTMKNVTKFYKASSNVKFTAVFNPTQSQLEY